MYRKTILGITTITLLVLATLFILLNAAKMPNEKKNGFNRRWLADSVSTVKKIETKLPFEKICGITQDHFFVTVPNPEWLFMLDRNLKKQRLFHLPIKVTNEIIAHNLIVDSPWIYMYANNLSSVLVTKLDDKKMDTIKFVSQAFTRSANISSSSFIIRGFDSAMKEQVFKKIDKHTGKVIHEAVIFSKRDDIGIGTDGLLKYDSVSHKVIYVQYYQNNFYCLDTNLNLVYKSKTIDTTNSNPITIKNLQIEGDDYLMPATPRVEVNGDCSVSNGYIFVVSKLVADNEKMSAFRENAAIDIYRLGDGKYIASFHIPNIAGEKIKSLLVDDKFLVAIYETHIGTYTIKI